jgi:putative hydrolase of the HAD superfamily
MTLRGLMMDWGGVLTDGPELLDLVRRATAAGVPAALVSDAVSVPDDCAAAFDVVVLGSALGVRKPDPDVFRQVAGLLGVSPEECVVVDDLARNLRGARAAGAAVVHHVDVARTIAEVEILLDL